MEHRFGQVDLIRWQGRRNRRARSSVSLRAFILAAGVIVGMAAMAAQASGILHLAGLAANIPAVLVVVALCMQAIALARAAVAKLNP